MKEGCRRGWGERQDKEVGVEKWVRGLVGGGKWWGLGVGRWKVRGWG